MKRPASKLVRAAVAFGIVMIVLAAVRAAMRRNRPDGGSSSEGVPCGEGFFRLSSFNTRENVQEAMERIGSKLAV